MGRERATGTRSAGRGRAVAVVLAALLAACASSEPPAGAVAPDTSAAPTSALGSYLAARHAQEERDYAHAAAFMGEALARDPDNLDLIRRTFVLRVSEGEMAQAVPLAQRLAGGDHNHNPGLPEIVLLLQDAKAGNFAAAAERARGLPRDGAQRLSVPLLLAWCEMGLGQTAAAMQALDSLKDVRGIQTLADLHRAMLADIADKLEEAEGGYKKVIADQPELSWRAVEMAGNFYERHQRSEEARRLYERLAANDQGEEVVAPALQRIAKGEVPPRIVASPRDGLAEALFDLASILNQRETLDAALIYARLALDLRPDFPLVQMLVAEIAQDQKHTAEALADYRAVDPKAPLAWAARLRAAATLDALDRTDEAAAELKAMAAERPHSPEPLIELGDLLRGRSRFAEAAAAYDAGIARVEKTEPSHWRLFYSRAVALERAGEWPRAERDLKRALELEDEQPLVLNYLGYSWIDKGVNLEEALKMIKRAVELRPNDGYIIDSLGWAYYRLGDFAKATETLEHAIELLPEDPTINDHLGDAYWQAGRTAEARFQWRRALQFKPEAEDVKTIEGKLDRGLAKLPAAAAMRGG
jgi:tetratricopeptide (TPR) repeat protein